MTESPILYSLVAYQTTFLADYSAEKGNFSQVVKPVLEKVKTSNASKTSYLYDDDCVIHILTDSGYTFLCICYKRFGNRRPFSYLQSVKDHFISQFPDAKKSATHMGLQKAFSKTLKTQLKSFENDKLTIAQERLDEVSDIAVKNIEKVLDRGSKIEMLVKESNNLVDSGEAFRYKSKKLKNAMWKRNLILMGVLLLIILIVVFVIIWLACGWTFERCISIFIPKDN